MSNVNAIDTLYAYDDGDTITPSMGVSIAAGHALAQFWDANAKSVSADSDFTVAANRPTIYPLAFSSSAASYIVPDADGAQWYLNNLGSDTAGILSDTGAVKSSFSDRFSVTTYTVNGKTYPALKIIGNLCDEDDLTSKVLYYQGTYNGKQFTCSIDIPITSVSGTQYEVTISCVNEDGVNDTVIDADTETLTLTSFLTAANAEVSASSYKWQKLVGDTWTDLTTSAGVQTVSSNGRTLTVYDAGLDGTESFKAVVTLDSGEYTCTIMLSDTHDPYYVDKGKDFAGESVKTTDTVTYTPKVYCRSTGALQSGWSFSYSLTDNDGEVLRESSSSVTSFSVAGSDVHEHGTINVNITASK
ncbi:MAG: hypothetical protein SNG69_08930 [Rikenellaceae bacterium]